MYVPLQKTIFHDTKDVSSPKHPTLKTLYVFIQIYITIITKEVWGHLQKNTLSPGCSDPLHYAYKSFLILDVYLDFAGLKYKLNQPLLLIHDPQPFKICICPIPIEQSQIKMPLMKNQAR